MITLFNFKPEFTIREVKEALKKEICWDRFGKIKTKYNFWDKTVCVISADRIIEFNMITNIGSHTDRNDFYKNFYLRRTKKGKIKLKKL